MVKDATTLTIKVLGDIVLERFGTQSMRLRMYIVAAGDTNNQLQSFRFLRFHSSCVLQ
jgi:hypothetical protein